MNGFNLSDMVSAQVGSTNVSAVYYGATLIWPKHDYSQDPFTITSLSDNNTISIVSTLASDVRMYKWDPSDKSNTFVSTTLNANSTHTVGTLNTGDSYAIVIFSSSQFNIGKSTSEYINITATDNFKVSGNITTLLDEDPELFDSSTLENESYAFYHLFYNNTYLSDASNLVMPATTLADSCYREMFKGCSSLTSAPILSAVTLAANCYRAMFSGCAFTVAPTLPATTLADHCYYYMFENCTSLSTVQPALPATTLADYCYGYMFKNCTSLTTAPELPATTLAEYCYRNMFWGCSSLTAAPALPATTLAQYCYNSMFKGCTSLSYIKCLATNISASSSHNYWLSNVASTGTFVKPSSMTSWPSGTSGIPSGWTVVNV